MNVIIIDIHLSPGGGGGVLEPKMCTYGSLPGSNPCSLHYNRVKYRGYNSTFRENIGVKTLHSEKILG